MTTATKQETTFAAQSDPELPSYQDVEPVDVQSGRLVRIPIKASDLESPSAIVNGGEVPQRNPITTSKKSRMGRSKPENEFRIVQMSLGDYKRYWAKGNDGQYQPSVIEPPEGRSEWVRRQLELNEVWRKGLYANDKEYAAREGTKTDKLKYGLGHTGTFLVVAATGPFGIGAVWGWDKYKNRKSKSQLPKPE